MNSISGNDRRSGGGRRTVQRRTPGRQREKNRRSRRGIYAGIGAAAVLALAVGIGAAVMSGGTHDSGTERTIGVADLNLRTEEDAEAGVVDAADGSADADGTQNGEAGSGSAAQNGSADAQAGTSAEAAAGEGADAAAGAGVGVLTDAAGSSDGSVASTAGGSFAGESSIRLVMVGDVLFHDNLESLAKQKDGSYDYGFIFAEMTDQLQAADLALANQEVIIGGKKLGVSGYPTFNASFELADALTDAGFDVVLHATNHAYDKGEKGILNCLSNWRSTHPEMAVLGIHDSEEDAQNIYVYEQDGMRIAVLNYTDLMNASVSSGKSYLVDRLTEKAVRSDIERAHTLADLVVVCPHWGTEYSNGIDKKQEKWTQIFLEEEVDLVIGTHSHVIEPVKMVTDEKSGHEMLVYYSLGNFCSWISKTGKETQKRVIGGMAEVTIGRKDDGSVGILDYGVEPLICHIAKDAASAVVYPYSEYSDTLAAQHLDQAYTGNFSMKYIDDYCDQIWGDLWREQT